MLRAASSAGIGDKLCVFEIDSLRYYHKYFLNKRLPKAKQFFADWYTDQEESDLLQEFRQNLEESSPDVQLI